MKAVTLTATGALCILAGAVLLAGAAGALLVIGAVSTAAGLWADL